MMKNKALLTAAILLFCTLSLLHGQGRLSKYVTAPEENLRAAPNGVKIGTLLEGTEVVVIEEQGNWSKVMMSGWIWKPSLSLVKTRSSKNQMRALHILTETRAKAEEALRMVEQGTTFETVAKQMSISPTAAKGGDLGMFEPGDFEPAISKAIVALSVGQVSGIIQTANGFHLFKRLK